jgi:hypothetical protein
MIGDSAQNITKPGARIDVVHLCGDDERIHVGGPFAAAIRRGLILPEFSRMKSPSDTRSTR